MNAIIMLYWQICRMRTGPEQVPPVLILTVVTFLAYALLSFAAYMGVSGLAFEYSAMSLMVITALWALLVYGVLAFKGLAPRFQQTFTAVLGTDVVLTALSLPLLVVSKQFSKDSTLFTLAAVLWLVIFIWNILIKGFIFHRAFNVSPLLGNLFSLTLNFLIMMVDQSLLNQFDPEALKALEGK